MDMEHYQSCLNDGGMIERCGSFMPPTRKGYTANRSELHIQKNVAKKIYEKRLSLARHMAQSTSYDTQEIVYSALVHAGISPHSARYYDDYIQLLVDRQGGWDRWRTAVQYEVDAVEYARGKVRIPLVYVTLWMLFSLAVIGMINNSSLWEGLSIIMAIIMIAVVGCVSWFVIYKNRMHLAHIVQEYVGQRGKKTEEFFTYAMTQYGQGFSTL